METLMCVGCGIILGIVGALPQAWMIRRARRHKARMASGLIATLVSFGVMSLALAFLYGNDSHLKLIFAISMVGTFFGLWSCMAYKHFKTVKQNS